MKLLEFIFRDGYTFAGFTLLFYMFFNGLFKTIIIIFKKEESDK
jgi:hypothetical protein